MPRKRFSAEQIIAHLREAEVLLAKGQSTGEVCRHLGIAEQTYYRWRNTNRSLMRQPTPRGSTSNATTPRSQAEQQRSSHDSVAPILKDCPCFFLARNAFSIDRAISNPYAHCDGST